MNQELMSLGNPWFNELKSNLRQEEAKLYKEVWYWLAGLAGIQIKYDTEQKPTQSPQYKQKTSVWLLHLLCIMCSNMIQ
jgi:hypothetical protein